MAWARSTRLIFSSRLRAQALRHDGLGNAAEEDRGAVGGAAEIVTGLVLALAQVLLVNWWRNSIEEPSALKR